MRYCASPSCNELTSSIKLKVSWVPSVQSARTVHCQCRWRTTYLYVVSCSAIRCVTVPLVSRVPTQMRFELPSLYTILTKLGDITDRLTRNLSEKFKAYPIIRHYVTAQSNVFCPIFITIQLSTPISTKFFGQQMRYCASPSCDELTSSIKLPTNPNNNIHYNLIPNKTKSIY